jgi:hypothetical protein
MFWQKPTFLAVFIFVGFVKCSKNCRKIDQKDDHFRSVIFAEAHGSGLGSQLFVYALMSQLRAEYNFDTFVSQECRSILSNVFTVTSLSDVPVFEETFCVDHPSSVGHFEAFTEDIQNLIDRNEFRNGRLVWLWPHKEKFLLKKSSTDKSSTDKSSTEKIPTKPTPYSTHNVGLQGYR